jgi:putative spermidine/putrescine transport system substrate-binding protein
MRPRPTRRRVLGGAAGLLALGGSPSQLRAAQAGPTPASPIVLTVLDASGALRQTQPAFEAYHKARPDLVSKVVYSDAPAPKVEERIQGEDPLNPRKARPDLVLVTPALLSAGIAQKLWLPLLPGYADALPNLQEILLPSAWAMQDRARGQGIVVNYCPCGPILEYMTDRVASAPGTADELLAWAHAHPNRFTYARPTRSRAGRAFLMGLPYLLGDVDPKDPMRGWAKTWSYLEQIDRVIARYPATADTSLTWMQLGQVDLVVSTTIADMSPRMYGRKQLPTSIAPLRGFHWISDAHYVVVPGVTPDARVPVLLDLIGFLLTRDAQALMYDFGTFYPGPAVAGVTPGLAPPDTQDRLRIAGRPEYAGLIANNPAETPLDEDRLGYATRRWAEQIGNAKS